jgi:hypothetical protein
VLSGNTPHARASIANVTHAIMRDSFGAGTEAWPLTAE